MTDINARIENAQKEITGNEALLDMLDADAAAEMLDWGIAMAASIAKRTEGLDDAAAELVLAPGLKTARQSLRSIGNWAAGKYDDPASRAPLRDKLLEQLEIVLREKAKLFSVDELDNLLNQVDESGNPPHQLILKLKELIEKKG